MGFLDDAGIDVTVLWTLFEKNNIPVAGFEKKISSAQYAALFFTILLVLSPLNGIH